MSILVSRVCSCFTFTLIAHPAMVRCSLGCPHMRNPQTTGVIPMGVAMWCESLPQVPMPTPSAHSANQLMCSAHPLYFLPRC